MTKPPKARPHSDIDGVRQDQPPNVASAAETSKGAADLERARRKSAGRPPYSGDGENRDDRS